MHFTAPKEPIVTSPPVTTTQTTTKVTTSTTVSTTTHVVSSATELGGTYIEIGTPYVEAIDQNYNYDDKEYNLYGTTVCVPVYKDDNVNVIVLYWSDGSITYCDDKNLKYYKTLQYSFVDLNPKYEYSSPAEAYKALCPDMNEDIDADIGFSCRVSGSYHTDFDEVVKRTVRMHFSAPKKIKGDVNLDGEFNVSDAVLLQKWLLAVPDVELKYWKNADFYEDGKLDVFDLCLMKRALISQ